MKTLADLVGEKITIQLHHTLLEEKHNVMTTRLLQVESGGIWVEGLGLAEFLQTRSEQPLSKTPAFFVPYAQIVWIMESADYPYLPDKSLGLNDF